MAPFNTHFFVAETIWPELDGPWQPFIGQFYFGSVAPDVDKLSKDLTQKDTHFFDRTTAWELMASHRSATFLQNKPRFLSRPFSELSAEAQAFALGYLCHLCVDEVSKFMWGRQIWPIFKGLHPGAAFAAVDEEARKRIQEYGAIVAALNSVTALDVVPVIPTGELAKFLTGVINFAGAKTVEGEFLALVDLFFASLPAAEREQYRQVFAVDIAPARRRVHAFNLDTMVRAGVNRTRHRLADLIAGRAPQPDFPEIE